MKKVVKYNGAFKSQLKHFTLQLSLAMVNSIKHWQLQQCKQKLTIAVVHKKVFVDCSSAIKSYQVYKCRQKLSLVSCAHKSYRSFDAILRFFIYFLHKLSMCEAYDSTNDILVLNLSSCDSQPQNRFFSCLFGLIVCETGTEK